MTPKAFEKEIAAALKLPKDDCIEAAKVSCRKLDTRNAKWVKCLLAPSWVKFCKKYNKEIARQENKRLARNRT